MASFLRGGANARLVPMHAPVGRGCQGPALLVDGTLLISGQIERVTDFEKGFPIHYRRRGHDWEPDFMVWDDQCVMVNVRGEGLVVISACSHSGVINTLLNARRLGGEARILAFIGGWHLSPASMWPVLDRTVAEFTKLGVRYTVPGHCTGWRANAELSRLLPEGFIQSSVGTIVRFGSSTRLEPPARRESR
jgi:7,8-dihydropterin-6-yl-methyl-4-(beta-D-ribofuranosyl)aminobenzene 5'-phosphate synthase